MTIGTRIIWFLVTLILIVSHLFPFRYYYISSSAGEEALWPPVGSEAEYRYRIFMVTRPILEGIKKSMPDAYQKLKSMVPSGPSGEVNAFSLMDWLRGKALSGTLRFKVEGFEGGLVKIRVSFTLDITNYTPEQDIQWLSEEPLTVLGSTERVVYVDPQTRIMYGEDGRLLGVWHLYLMPWELYEGSRVKVFSGYIYPDKYKDELVTHVTLKGYGNIFISGVEREWASRLGIPLERLLKGSGITLVLAKGLPEEEKRRILKSFEKREEVKVIEGIDEFLGEVKRSLGCGSRVSAMSVQSPFIFASDVNVVVDGGTGLVVHYRGPSDIFFRVFGMLDARSPRGCPMSPFPETIVMYLVEFKGFNPVGAGGGGYKSATTTSRAGVEAPGATSPPGAPPRVVEAGPPAPRSDGEAGLLTPLEGAMIVVAALVVLITGALLYFRGRGSGS